MYKDIYKDMYKDIYKDMYYFSSGAHTFGMFCSYFQNSSSIACLRERNPSAKQEKYLS